MTRLPTFLFGCLILPVFGIYEGRDAFKTSDYGHEYNLELD